LQSANVTPLDLLLIQPEQMVRSLILIVLPLAQQLVSDREDDEGHGKAVLPAAGVDALSSRQHQALPFGQQIP
jgi:hypothetical protein